MAYAARAVAPRTLTHDEIARLLRVTGAHAQGYRDHMLFSMALGTGLREFELVALDCGQVFARAKAHRRITLRVFKRCTERPAPQEVFVPDALRQKLTQFRKWKKERGENIAADAPLFVTVRGRGSGRGRLSTRAVRHCWALWRARAELSESLTFHALRHTFCQRLYEQEGDPRLVQKAARHATIATTMIYTAPSSQRLAEAVRDLKC